MDPKKLLAIVVLLVFGVGAWGSAWLVLHPTQPWPRLDGSGRPDTELR